MKKLFLVSIAIILSTNLFGQDTKFILVTTSGSKKSKEEKSENRNIVPNKPVSDFTEEYYVLKNDEAIRHGTYVKYRRASLTVQLLEAGSYSNGKQNGLWEYYHDN